MSCGPGRLGRRVLEALREAPDCYLEWGILRARFPLQVRDKSFYRCVRSLKRSGHIEIVDDPSGPTRTVHLVGFAGGANRGLLDLLSAAYQQYATVARARGIPVPPPSAEEVRRELAKRREPKGPGKTAPRA